MTSESQRGGGGIAGMALLKPRIPELWDAKVPFWLG